MDLGLFISVLASTSSVVNAAVLVNSSSVTNSSTSSFPSSSNGLTSSDSSTLPSIFQSLSSITSHNVTFGASATSVTLSSGSSSSAASSSVVSSNSSFPGFTASSALNSSVSTSALRNSSIITSSTRPFKSSACPRPSTFGYTPGFIASTGSGLAYASSCSTVIGSWEVASSAFLSALPYSNISSVEPGSTGFETFTLASPALPSGASVTELCGDGFTRAGLPQAALPTLTGTTTTTLLANATTQVYSSELPSCVTDTFYPMPSCSISPADCTSLYLDWSSQHPGSTTFIDPAICYTTGSLSATPTTTGTPQCTIRASNVQVYYWPVTTTGSPTCDGTDGLTWQTVAPPEGTRTAVITSGPTGGSNLTNSTLTVTSPSVYLAITGVSADFGSVIPPNGNATLGTVFTGPTVIPMLPQDLSSVAFGLNGFTGDWQQELSLLQSTTPAAPAPYVTVVPINGDSGEHAEEWDLTQQAQPYNLFNLQRPVPASAYFLGTLRDYYQQTIIYDDYHPLLAVPPQLRSVEAAWASCALDLDGIYDPPQPIVTGSFVAVTPSKTPIGGGPPTQTASPGGVANPPGPTVTGKPPAPPPPPSAPAPAPAPAGSPASPPSGNPSSPSSNPPAPPTPPANPPAPPANPPAPSSNAPAPVPAPATGSGSSPSSGNPPNGNNGNGQGNNGQGSSSGQADPSSGSNGDGGAPASGSTGGSGSGANANGNSGQTGSPADPSSGGQAGSGAQGTSSGGSSNSNAGSTDESGTQGGQSGGSGASGSAPTSNNGQSNGNGASVSGSGSQSGQASGSGGNIQAPGSVNGGSIGGTGSPNGQSSGNGGNPAPLSVGGIGGSGNSGSGSQGGTGSNSGAQGSIGPGSNNQGSSGSGSTGSSNQGGIATPGSTSPSNPSPGQTILPIGGSPVTVTATQNAAGQPVAVISGQTLAPGGTITVNGQTVRANPDGTINLGGATNIALPTAAPGGSVNVGGSNIPITQTTNTAGQPIAVIAGQTLVPGTGTATFNGATVALANNGNLVVASTNAQEQIVTSTVAGFVAGSASQPASAVILPIGPNGSPLTAAIGVNAQGQSTAIVNGRTLTIGDTAATVNSVTISLGSNRVIAASTNSQGQRVTNTAAASALGGTNALSLAPGQTLSPTFTTASNGARAAILGNGITLTAGGPAATISGHIVSLAASGNNFTVDGTTQAPSPITSGSTSAATAVLSGADGPITAIQSSTVGADGKTTTFGVVNGQTLTSGGQATSIGGHAFSVGPNGALIEDGTSTVVFTTPSASVNGIITTFSAPGVNGPLTATLSSTVGADGKTTTVELINGMTLTAGGAASTISGQVFNLSPNGALVENRNTTVVPGKGTPTGSAAGVRYTGAAERNYVRSGAGLMLAMIVGVLWL